MYIHVSMYMHVLLPFFLSCTFCLSLECVCVCMHVHVCTYTFRLSLVCVYTCMYMYLSFISCVCTCMCVYTCMYMYFRLSLVYMYMYTCTFRLSVPFVCLLSVYVCVYMYVHVPFVYLLCVCVYMYVHVHVPFVYLLCVYMYVCVYTCMYMYLSFISCVCTCMCVCIHVCTCTFRLSLTASQMWCLGRFLPILIGDLVPEEHCYWENFLTLLDIVNELFAPVTTTDRADYVSLLVEVFLGGFKELYPARPLTPKMHYMVHLATWTKRYIILDF